MDPSRIAHRKKMRRLRVAKWRKLQRETRHDPVAFVHARYNGAALGKLVAQGYLLETESADKAKVGSAISQLLRDWTYE